MNIEAELKKFENAEKELHKQIDSEVSLENEIQEVAKYTARLLESKPLVPFSIQNRDFILVSGMHTNENNETCIQLVAREKLKIDIATPKIIKADLVIDTNYSKEENLVCGIKALLGHITGHIKPEVLD